MGNTYSSSGTIVGSVLGGLLIAPFTDWPTFVAIIIASCIGIIIGTTTFIYNTLHKNIPQKIEKKSYCWNSLWSNPFSVWLYMHFR